MSSKIGYFVMNQMQGQRGWTSDENQHFFDHIQRLQPSAMLFLDDYGKALQVKSLLPDCAVIVRSYRSDIKEGELWQKRTPQQVFDDYKSTDPRLIRLIMNEPNSYISDDDLHKLVKWSSDVMDLFGNAGIPIAIPGFGEGHPDVDRLAALEALWTAFDKWHDLHIYNAHEYATWRGMLFNEGGKYDVTPWRIGRFETFVVPYLNKTGHKIPRVIVGEFGCDSAHDNTSNRGWRSAWSEDHYADEIKAAVDRFYHLDHYIGLTLFTWGNTGKPFTEDDWSTFDVSTAAQLQERLESMSVVSAPVQSFDYGAMLDARLNVYNVDAINLRADTNTNSAILAHLLNGTDIKISEHFSQSGDHNWFRVSYQGMIGYVADTSNWHISTVIPQVPPETAKKAIVVRFRGLTQAEAEMLVHNVIVEVEDE